MRLCLPIHAGRKPLGPGGHIFPCSPMMATVRLFHPPPSVSDAHPRPLPPPSFGIQSCVLSLVHSVCSSDPASRDSPSGSPSLLPPTAFWIPHQKTAEQETSGAVSCASVHPVPSITLDPWKPKSSFLPFPSSSCLF